MVRDPASMSDRELAEWAASLDADARRRIQTALLVAAERSNGSNNYTAAAGSNPTGGSSYSAAAGYNPAGTNQETLPLPPPPGSATAAVPESLPQCSLRPLVLPYVVQAKGQTAQATATPRALLLALSRCWVRRRLRPQHIGAVAYRFLPDKGAQQALF